MGFISSLKNIKNFVTGGSATVTVHWDELSLHETFPVTVRAQTGDSAVKIKRVYLEIEGLEEVKVPNHEVVLTINEQEHRNVHDVHRSGRTLHLQYESVVEQELAANQEFEWVFDVTFPDNAQPPFSGNYGRHGYRVYAGLDTFGNDPDSGWVDLN